MKVLHYQRKAQFTEEIETHIGLYDEVKNKDFKFVQIINPIINGIVWRGICHTNHFNVVEVDENVEIIDSITGKNIVENN